MRNAKLTVVLLALLAGALSFSAAAAQAEALKPWWHLTVGTRPADLPAAAGEKGAVVVTVANLGDAAAESAIAPIEIEDTLPAGLKLAGNVEAFAGGTGAYSRGGVSCPPKKMICTFKGTFTNQRGETLAKSLPPYDQIEMRIPVETLAGAHSGEANTVTVSGGGAAPAGLSRPLAFGAQTPFGVEAFELSPEEEGGGADTQAGSHPYQLTTTLSLNQLAGKGEGTGNSYHVGVPALPKDVHFHWPAGLVGNPSKIERCSLAQFLTTTVVGEDLINFCPASSAVGVATLTLSEPLILGTTTFPLPIFNLEPAFGQPARFGFFVTAAIVPVLIEPSLRQGPGGDYGIDVASTNISQIANLLATKATVWGTPGDPSHDNSRGWGCIEESREFSFQAPCRPVEEEHPPAFLTLPTSCSGSPLQTSVEADSWLDPLDPTPPFASDPPLPTLDGCNQIPFGPTVKSEPTADAASTGTGLNFELNVNDEGLTNPEGLGASDIKKAVVTLPEGITADASLAEGLGVCGPHEYEATRIEAGSGCPETSKIGELEAESPLVEGKVLRGSLYIAKPQENPFGSLLAMYMVIRNPELGVLVKAAGHIEADPRTGQLITTFDNLPQLPVSRFRLHLREGQRAPLITPPACGTYAVQAVLFPWSDPSHGLERESSFKIERGVGGGPCPGSPLPFHPGFEAGSQNNVAGSYSPFELRLTRGDGEQDITKFSSVLPPGMVGKIAGVTKCPQADVEAAKRLSGRQEQASPSCPANSQIGTTLSGAGVGSTLVYVPGKLYLGGPYHGDPLSVIAIVPAVAGPFDVGDVVVQEALTLNPVTAEVEVDGAASDPIPHSLQGIPLNVREIRVDTDRPQFTLNPTSCERFSTRATLWAGGTALHPGSESPFGLASPFQAADCASLGFAPNLQIKLRGGTRRGKFPALRAEVAPRPGDANFSSAVVTLPHSAFLEQGHFGTICTRVQFAAGAGDGAGCPAASVYGTARASTPLLEETLEGPVYLRSSDHNLPDLVVVLHGIVTVVLDARIDSLHGGIRSTFEGIPDAPVSHFTLEMQGGKKGLIVNSTNLCAKPKSHRAEADLTGQNGRLDRAKPVVAPQCKKHKRKKHKRHRKHKRHHRRAGA
jgi:hypothetical protein